MCLTWSSTRRNSPDPAVQPGPETGRRAPTQLETPRYRTNFAPRPNGKPVGRVPPTRHCQDQGSDDELQGTALKPKPFRDWRFREVAPAQVDRPPGQGEDDQY